MRILTVHNQFREYAGADIVAVSDDKILSEHHEVTTYLRNSNEIVDAGLWQKVNFGLSTVYSQRTARDVTNLVKRFHPEIAYVHNVFPLISPSLYHRLHALRVPSVHIIHDYRLWCPNSRFYINDQRFFRCQHGNYWAALQNRCVQGNLPYSAIYAGSLYLNRKLDFMQKIDGFICLSEFTKQLLLQSDVPEHKLHVCPNHIDTSMFTPQYSGGRYVLYLGGLYRDKGVMTILKTFAQLPHIPLKFVGAGPEEQPLRDYVQEHRLQNIEIVGYKSGEEKAKYLRDSMFTVVASQLNEPFGLVVLEAYASGKPVVASTVGALPYLVEPGQTGLMFKSQDVGELVQQVSWLYERPDEIERMGRKARALVEQKYDSRLRYELLRAIFEEVIDRARMN
ncbi:MAG: glycosyltransferase family 4 protein [Candidatus Sulfotelmatobacter sp.]